MKTFKDDFFKFMCNAHEKVFNLVDRLHFDKKHPWHLNLVSLYGTILELTGSACILIREGMPIGVPILLRSALEAYADFKNLAANKEYGFFIKASFLDQYIKMLEEAENRVNPYLNGIEEFSDKNNLLEIFQVELNEIKKKGYSSLNIKDKFSKANLEQLYRSVYNLLCCYSHNNIRALLSRHIRISADQKDFDVVFNRSVDLNRLLPYIDTFCYIIIDSTKTIHQILQSNVAEQISKLEEDLKKHRENCMKKFNNTFGSR